MNQAAMKRCLICVVFLLSIFSVGTAQHASAVVGGQNAATGEFPFLVALVSIKDGHQFCGGSIINEEWVLTAAHCFYSDGTPPVQDTFEKDVHIKAGIIDLNDPNAQVSGVTKIYDPGYDGDTHDIALLQLATPLNLDNTTVAPLKLNTDLKFPDIAMNVMVAGWGYTDVNAQTFSPLLQKVTLPVVGCSSDTAAEYICAGEKGKDTCQGDSGGPLVTLQATDIAATADANQQATASVATAEATESVPGIHALQIGIVSYGGDKCGLQGAYTRVASYTNWINKTIADNSNK